MKGGDTMTVYEALSLMIAFATLVVLIISFKDKNKPNVKEVLAVLHTLGLSFQSI